MTAIKTVVTALCVGAIGFGCVKMFVPKGGLEKSTTMLLSLLLLFLLISTVKNGGSLDFTIPTSGTQQTVTATVDINRTIIECAEQKIEQEIKNALQSDGISFQDVQVYMDILDNNSISITKVNIHLNPSKEVQNSVVKNRVYALTGVYPMIINKG